MHQVNKFKSDSNDFQVISDFFQENAQYIAERTPWTYQRFVDWKYGQYDHRISIEGFWDTSLIYFTLEDTVIGLAINEDGNEMITIVTSPEFRHLFGDFLDIALEDLLHKGDKVMIELSQHQDIEASVLKELGYVRVGEFCKFIYNLRETNTICSLPEGFTIHSMFETEQYEGQAKLRSLAFSGEDLSEITQMDGYLKILSELHQAPTYFSETDLVVIDPVGQVVAGCEPLINFKNKDAEIERVCTLASHRGMGFAKTVIGQALKKLQDLGLEKAYITGFTEETKHLYSSFGGSQAVKMYTYSKAK